VAEATPCWPAPVSAMMRGLPIFHGEQALADSVVDFVRASMEEILALEINTGATEFFREARSKLQRCRAAGEIF